MRKKSKPAGIKGRRFYLLTGDDVGWINFQGQMRLPNPRLSQLSQTWIWSFYFMIFELLRIIKYHSGSIRTSAIDVTTMRIKNFFLVEWNVFEIIFLEILDNCMRKWKWKVFSFIILFFWSFLLTGTTQRHQDDVESLQNCFCHRTDTTQYDFPSSCHRSQMKLV